MKKNLHRGILSVLFVAALAALCLLCSIGSTAVSGVTEVRTYSSDNSLTREETYTDVGTAWDKAMSYAASSAKVSIVLGDNWTHDRELRIGKNCNVTIDLNGYYIHRNRNYEFESNGGVFYVEEGATLTIQDSRPKSRGYDGLKGGVITGGASGNTAGGIHLCEGSSLYMEGGTIYACTTRYNGGAICMDEGSNRLEMRNCRVYFCQTVDSRDNCYGGGIYIENNNFTLLENMTIDCCYSEDDGGAIFFDNKGRTLKMRDVVFASNRAHEQGGALYVDGLKGSIESNISATRCFFLNNVSRDEGGAVYVNGKDEKNNNPTLFKECVFRENTSEKAYGGAIYVNDRHVALCDTEVTGNTAYNEGGGIYVDSYYDLSIKGTIIIRDNKRSDKSNQKHRNLCLQEGISSTARVYSGGLYRSSYIEVSTTDDETHFSRNITRYQMRYFHPESGNMEFEKKDTVATPIFASLYGNGSLWVVAAILALGIVGALIAIIVKKKGGRKNGND